MKKNLIQGGFIMKKGIGFILVLSIIVNLVVIFPVMAEEDDLFTMDELVVTATRYPVEMSETPVSIEVITEEEVQNTNADNVGELLDDVSGVNIRDNGGAGLKTIHIRGSASSQVLVLMDGQPINNVQNGDTDLGQLPLSNVKKIEVLKGPASAIYGANALGGVVNIITKDIHKEANAEFKVAYGSYNTSDVKLNYSAREGKTGLIFTLNKKASDGFREIPADNSAFDQMSFFSKIDHQINNNSNLVLIFHYNDSDKESPGMLSDSNSDGDYDDMYDLAGTPNGIQNDMDKNINIKWEQNKSCTDTTVMIYSNQHELAYSDAFTDDVHKTNNTGLEFNKTNYLDEHTIAYGLEVKNSKIDSTKNGEHDFLNKAVYIHDEWEIKGPLKITIGARYDDHEKFGSEISPRLGMVYNLNKETNLHFSAGKAYRTPTYNDLYYPVTMYAEGDPDLKPETGIAYEAGITNLKEDVKTGLTIFQKDIENYIFWTSGDDFVWRPYNLQAFIKGAELVFEKQLNKCLSFNMNYTYLDSINEETEEQLAGEAKHNANLRLKYTKNDYGISLNGRYVGGRADESLEDYTVVDARVSKAFTAQGRDFNVALNINNLLNNEDYQINKGYPMPDCNYMLEVSTRF